MLNAQAEEAASRRLASAEEEFEMQMQAAKQSHKRYEDELRATMAERDKISLTKLEEMRGSHARREDEWAKLKEDMQMANIEGTEILKREFQQRLKEIHDEHQHSLQQVQHGKVEGAIKDLQLQLSAKENLMLQHETEANETKMQLVRLKTRETLLVEQLDAAIKESKGLQDTCTALQQAQKDVEKSSADSSSKRENDLRGQRDDLTRRLTDTNELLQESHKLQQSLMDETSKMQAELQQVRDKHTDLEDKFARKDRECETLKSQKSSLVTELNVASQTLLKRGEDFSESISLLEMRLADSGQDVKKLGESLILEQDSNARLTSELQTVKARITETSNDSSENVKTIAAIQQRLELGESEHASECEVLNGRITAMQSSHAAAIQKMEQGLAQKESTIENLETSLSSSTSRAAEAQRNVEDLTRRLRDLEAQLEVEAEAHNVQGAVVARMNSIEKENQTLTGEMDKVIQENAIYESCLLCMSHVSYV